MTTELSITTTPRAGAFAAAPLSVVGVFAVRVPHRMAEGYLWAEDLTVFLRGACEADVDDRR